MKFLIYSLNFTPELTGIGKYNGEMASSLVGLGCDIDVLCAPPYYPEWQIKEEYKRALYRTEKLDGANVFRSPLYVPKRVNTLKRLIHLASFALTSGLRLLTLWRKRYDVVFVVQPTLFCVPITLFYCWLTGAKALMHVQDYELDAMLGLGIADKGKVATILLKIESWLLKRFDFVSTISFSMLARAQAKGVPPEKCLFFPNWSDIKFVKPRTPCAEFKASLGLAPEQKVVLYAGNMGQKQGLDIVIEAAKAFEEKKDITFLMVGAGAYAGVLIDLAKRAKLTNIRFLPLQPWENVPSMLAMADIHLVIQKKGAADAVLPSKLTNILSVGGHAIVTAEANTELGELAARYNNIYDLIEPESISSLVHAIETGLTRVSKGPNLVARKYAEENLDREVIICRFVTELREKLNLNYKDAVGIAP